MSLSQSHRWLKTVTLLSGIYDCLLGLSLLFLQNQVVAAFGLAPPLYPINGNLNGLFALSIGLGYLAIVKEPEANLWYLWIMGVFLKSVGPALFLYDVFGRGAPSSFLLFGVFDGSLCIATLVALRLHKRAGAGSS